MHSVKVTMTAHGIGKVLIDGVELKGVRGLSYSASVNELNVLEIRMLVKDVEIEGPAEVSQKAIDPA